MRYLELLEYIDVNKTLQNLGSKLDIRIKEDHSASTSKEVIEKAMANDPTPNHKYVLWILRTYLNNGIRFTEDFSRTKVALIVFDKFKQQMTKKDINQIRSLSELEDIVEPFEDKKTGKELKKSEWEEIKEEFDVFYKGPEGKIVIPNTERASCALGRGTKWCTAATKSENIFNAYNRAGELYIILPKDGRKFQIHFEEAELVDEKDKEVNIQEFKKQYPWVFTKAFNNNFINRKLKKSGATIKFIDNPSEEDQLISIDDYPAYIKFINNPTEKVMKRVIDSRSTYSIKFIKNIPEHIKEYMINQDPESIAYLKNPSEELQLLAVSLNTHAFTRITNPTEKVKQFAVTKYAPIIKFVNDPSEEVQKIAVRKDPFIIKSLINPSEDVQIEAVKAADAANSSLKNCIDKPTEKVKQLAKNLGVDL